MPRVSTAVHLRYLLCYYAGSKCVAPDTTSPQCYQEVLVDNARHCSDVVQVAGSQEHLGHLKIRNTWIERCLAAGTYSAGLKINLCSCHGGPDQQRSLKCHEVNCTPAHCPPSLSYCGSQDGKLSLSRCSWTHRDAKKKPEINSTTTFSTWLWVEAVVIEFV